MPARVTKVKGGWQVRTPHAVKAKRTTKKKAMAQARLINRAHKRGSGLLA